MPEGCIVGAAADREVPNACEGIEPGLAVGNRRYRSTGMWDRLHARHVYLDANIIIEMFEGLGARSGDLKLLLREIEMGTILATTSEWTLAEVLVKPLATGDAGRVRQYEGLLSHAAIAVVEVGREVLVAAAKVCADTKMPLPDCVHVATAVRAGCDVFVSNDRDIVLPVEMERVVPGAGPL